VFITIYSPVQAQSIPTVHPRQPVPADPFRPLARLTVRPVVVCSLNWRAWPDTQYLVVSGVLTAVSRSACRHGASCQRMGLTGCFHAIYSGTRPA
jgi:hypothetical protein